MTDNFSNYKAFIEKCGGLPDRNEKGNLDKYYVIELIRRGKDNPDLPAANYRFKNYYVYSWRDLDKYEKEIKEVCNLLRLRAYCSVNYKMMSQVALDTVAESARRIAAHDYKKFYDIFESCSGQYVDHCDAKWIVDVDDDFNRERISDLIAYIGDMESEYADNPMFVMPTKSGIHLICHPFNLVRFNNFFDDAFPDCKMPDIKKNHLTLLYENL